MSTLLRRLPLAALLFLAAVPQGRADTVFSLYFNSESESVMSYEECRQKETQTVYYDCGSNLGIKLVIYASPSGACTNVPGTDAIILLSERTISTGSECSGTLSIDPSDIVGDSCECNTTQSLQLCAATKYQAYNYETLLTEWVEDETVSLSISYDSKPPTAPTLDKADPGDEALHLSFSGPSDITEYVACARAVAGSSEEEGESGEEGGETEAVVDEVSAIVRAAVGDVPTRDGETETDATEGEDTGTEAICEVGVSPLEDCEKTATFSGSGTTSGVIRDLVNGQAYSVTIVGRDAAGNYSPVSDAIEGTPMDVQDFFEAYVEAGGGEEGGFGCASAGLGHGAWMGLMPLIGALLLRRRGQRGRDGQNVGLEKARGTLGHEEK